MRPKYTVSSGGRCIAGVRKVGLSAFRLGCVPRVTSPRCNKGLVPRACQHRGPHVHTCIDPQSKCVVLALIQILQCMSLSTLCLTRNVPAAGAAAGAGVGRRGNVGRRRGLGRGCEGCTAGAPDALLDRLLQLWTGSQEVWARISCMSCPVATADHPYASKLRVL